LTNLSDSAVVLLSGGQDSTTALFWAKSQFQEVHTVTFNYGQRHKIEIESAARILALADIPMSNRNLINADVFSQFDDSALLDKSSSISEQHRVGNLPASFVPGRNLIFLTLAAMYAFKHQIHNIVAGVCQTDYSGYHDCRQATITSMQESLQQGMGFSFEIHTPLMHLTKADTVQFATLFDGCMEALAYSHTCYEGVYPPCDKCPACILRAKGFKEARVKDPLIERFERGE